MKNNKDLYDWVNEMRKTRTILEKASIFFFLNLLLCSVLLRMGA